MKVRVLFFARSREVTKETDVELALEEGATSKTLLELLVQWYPGLSEVLATSVLSRNQEYVGYGEDVALEDGDELAVIPPISGG